MNRCGIWARRFGLRQKIWGEICRWAQQRLLHACDFPFAAASGSALLLSGHGSVKSRVLHAIGSAFFTRTDSGLTAPNYSFLLGDLSSGALSIFIIPKRIAEWAWFSPMPQWAWADEWLEISCVNFPND